MDQIEEVKENCRGHREQNFGAAPLDSPKRNHLPNKSDI